MTLVIDASVVVSALTRDDVTGSWAESVLASRPPRGLTAPHLMPIEVANVLRRRQMAGRLSDGAARLAHADLLRMPFILVDYARIAERAWELRASVTLYDACYVALAEQLDVPLATLDGRLSRSPGPRCRFLTPSTC